MKKKVNKTIQGVSLKGLHLVILYNKNTKIIIFDINYACCKQWSKNCEPIQIHNSITIHLTCSRGQVLTKLRQRFIYLFTRQKFIYFFDGANFFFLKEKLLKKLWHSFSLCIIQSPRRTKSRIYNSTQRFANHKHSSSEGEDEP